LKLKMRASPPAMHTKCRRSRPKRRCIARWEWGADGTSSQQCYFRMV
jgi:hypothetical protein